jgi:hypothetical protein
MFEKKLSSLESRKRLLVAESEINRTLFVSEYQTLAGGIDDVIQPLRTLGSLAASAASLFAVFKVFRNRNSGSDAPKRSNLFVSLFRMALAIWTGLRAAKNSGSNSDEPIPHDTFTTAGS